VRFRSTQGPRPTLRRSLATAALILLSSALFAATALSGRAAPDVAPDVERDERDDGRVRDAWPVTSGAAPGYVPDAACAECHEAIATSYAEVSMSRSFYRPTAENVIEDYEHAHFFHAPSGNHYEMVRRDDGFYQQRYRVDGEGKRFALIERRVDWILGSGSNARNYVYRTERGELYELPLVWYAKTKHWGMAPGFDRPDHDDFGRRIGRRCMGCHNAYPDVPAGSDAFGSPELFPAELPHGTGCQRCHGPGAEHVRLAETGAAEDALRASIVNPARLPKEQRDDVCNQCHLQPSTTVESFVGVFGRGDYAFRPGMRLAEVNLPVDIDQGLARSERFEINHHPYRLAQSTCFVESGGALDCLTCHDPHRKVPASERAAHYRDRCLSCHAVDVCSMTPEHARLDGLGDIAPDDCAACHMPRHRARDAVQILATDHRIRRRPPPRDWSEPMPEERLAIRGAGLYRPERAPEGELGALLRLMPMVRLGDPAAMAALYERLLATGFDDVEPWLALGDALYDAERWEEAEDVYGRGLERAPELALAHAKVGAVEARLGRPERARERLERALELVPDAPEHHVDLARVLLQLGEDDAAKTHLAAAKTHLAAAKTHLQRAIAIRPTDFDAHVLLGNVLARQGELGDAIAAYRAARTADPREAGAHDNLALLQRARGNWEAAIRSWTRGAECAPDDAGIARHLASTLLIAPDDAGRSPEQALEHASRAAALDPDDGRSALVLALAFLETGRFDRALVESRRAEAAGAELRASVLLRAQALAQLGRDREARRALGEAGDARPVRSTPDDPLVAHIHLRYATLPRGTRAR
jgi:tetratricopeptide (TPR) repeat protein